MRKRPHVNRNNTSPAYWNGILKDMGMGVGLPRLPKQKFGTGKKMVRSYHGKDWTPQKQDGHAARSAG